MANYILFAHWWEAPVLCTLNKSHCEAQDVSGKTVGKTERAGNYKLVLFSFPASIASLAGFKQVSYLLIHEVFVIKC